MTDHYDQSRRSSVTAASHAAPGPAAIVALSAVLLAVTGLLDYLVGSEVSVIAFYLLPIALLAWYLGWGWGVAGAILATAIWLGTDIAGGLRYSQPAIYIWNSLMRLVPYAVVAYLFAQLRLVLRHEHELARTDFVTGSLNSRAFDEALRLEIVRASRYGHPLTVAYLDLDNFKSVNDRLGHSAGDAVLRALSTAAREVLRGPDLIARVGGDEFALLLPETGGAEARAALEKVRQCLLETMDAHDWPVTVSIGAVVCRGRVPAADDLLAAADTVMYAVKRAGKNGLQIDDLRAPQPD